MSTVTQTATSPVGVRPATKALVITNLIGQILIVFTGGWVRLTASGLGCSTWPQCEPGQFTPQLHAATPAHAYIEFGNRTVTVVLTAIGLAVAFLVWGERSRSRSYRALGFVPLAGVLAQAVIGGITVLLHLNPAIVSVHMIVSLALVAASTYLLARSLEGDGPAQRLTTGRGVGILAWVMAGLCTVVVVLGVVTTGAGPHSGDEQVAYRFALDPALMAQVHAGAVWLFIAAQVVAGVMVWRQPTARPARRAIVLLAVVTVAQGALGYIQYFTGLPVPVVAFHLLGAAGLVAATSWYLCRLRVRGPVVAPRALA